MSEQIKEQDDPIARFLAEGGKIQQGAYKQSGRVEGASYSMWGAKKPGRPPATEVNVTKPEDDQ